MRPQCATSYNRSSQLQNRPADGIPEHRGSLAQGAEFILGRPATNLTNNLNRADILASWMNPRTIKL
ncbi:hypothetical protein IPG36_01125 [bacterium]|nr:MAG: hypothetical protein IPG36_01125 [bacterium]